MNREQLEMLQALQANEFTAHELALYLDTHPNDQRALADFHIFNGEAQQQRRTYSAYYGPLMMEDSTDNTCWRWAEEPWPWEIDY